MRSARTLVSLLLCFVCTHSTQLFAAGIAARAAPQAELLSCENPQGDETLALSLSSPAYSVDTRILQTVISPVAPSKLRAYALDPATREARTVLWTTESEYHGNIADNDASAQSHEASQRGKQKAIPGYFSRPILVGAPSSPYSSMPESTAYSTFSNKNSRREPMVYVGEQAGALRAMSSRTGEELFVFRPRSHQAPLEYNSLQYTFPLDASPTVGDVFIGREWRTLLANSFGRSKQGIYAIDVTDPAVLAAGDSQLEHRVLWEFTDAYDPDVGFVNSAPAIAKMHNGKWAVIFGNGYGSKSRDSQNASESAVLFIVSAENGKLIRKLGTGTAGARPQGQGNGLSPPAAVDVDGDRTVDYLYAGDMAGNLWKFDVTSSTESDWKAALKGQPLFRARSETAEIQPIIARPEVTRARNGHGLIILLVAGATTWAENHPLFWSNSSSIYGIKDVNDVVVSGRENLQQQGVEGYHETAQVWLRATTSRSDSSAAGWYMDLDSNEQAITPPMLRDGRLFVATASLASSCPSRHRLWIMSLDARSGSAPRLGAPVFDVNDDGMFDARDNFLLPAPNSNAQPHSASALGIAIADALPGNFVILEDTVRRDSCVQRIYAPISSDQVWRSNISCGGYFSGRQIWRQLK